MTVPRNVDIAYGDFSFAATGLATPIVSLSTNLSSTAAGALIGGTLEITLEGKIVPTGILNNLDNYDNSSDRGGWADLTDRMLGLEKAFSEDYRKLMITCGVSPNQETTRPNNKAIWDFYQIDPVSTKVNNIEFSNSTDEYWNQIVDYTINLEVEITGATDYINKGGPYFVTDVQNSYNITPIVDNKFYQAIGVGNQYVGVDTSLTPKGYGTSSEGHLFPFATGDAFPAYTITRNLSAQGRATKPKYPGHPSTAVANAKHFVTGLLALDTQLFDVLDNLYVVNRNTTVETSESNGTYGITDTFTVYSGGSPRTFIDTFDINSTTDSNFNRTVTINGTIQGYPDYRLDSDNMYWNMTDSSIRDDTKFFFPLTKEPAVAVGAKSPYMQASGRLMSMVEDDMFYYRCLSTSFPSGFHNEPAGGSNHVLKSQSGYKKTLDGTTKDTFHRWSGWLNPEPLKADYTHDIEKGNISYSVTFDSRPASLVKGAFQESIEVEDDYATRQYMEQTILYGPPVINDKGTYNLPSRTVSYTANFNPISTVVAMRAGTAYIPKNTLGHIYNALNQFNPNRLNPQSVAPADALRYYYYSWISSEDENFDPINGQFSKTVTWNYELRYWAWYSYYKRVASLNFMTSLANNLRGIRSGNDQFETDNQGRESNTYE